MSKPTLDELRQQIDSIDDQIHDLILKRWDVVQHVAAAKGKAVSFPVRPTREASMLRRLAERHRGPFPFSALARMWHEMIAAFTMLQADYSVAVFANGDEHTLWDLARDQFGSQVPMTAYPTVRDTLAQVFENRHQIAVLPAPRESDDDPWWVKLSGANAPKVIMRMPFAGVGSVRGQMQDALAVARLKLEPTGSDRTLLLIETKEPLSRTGLNAILQRAKLHPLFTASAPQEESWVHLVELGNFVEEKDERLELIEVRDAVVRVEVVGGYAEVLGPDRVSAPIAGVTEE
ncbi:chorismate mutase [Rhodospirillaceae bacterium KN72]|uniref:chorismate mutase n=1 Tax=Pacificispira spongiicola TaxID=2729598 RepID=A0A7Y0DXQ7_9PROT|nr:chorismate mutase [Pacificispira spongiicola]NMM43543.1 chorismate mutase [Pacificispira spongiicola]